MLAWTDCCLRSLKTLSPPAVVEQVREEAVTAAGVDVLKRRPVAFEHQHGPRPALPGHRGSHAGKRLFHRRRQRVGLCGVADARADRPDGRHDVGHRAVLVGVIRDARSFETAPQLGLCPVDDHQVGPHRQDSFGVGIEQGADLRELRRFGRKLVVAADRDQPAAGAHREDHLGGGRNERDDPAGDGIRRGAERHAGGDQDQEQAFHQSTPYVRVRLTSSHRKNGPPMTAVTMPTGSSMGANSVRATRSQAIRNVAPNSADAGSTSR